MIGRPQLLALLLELVKQPVYPFYLSIPEVLYYFFYTIYYILFYLLYYTVFFWFLMVLTNSSQSSLTPVSYTHLDVYKRQRLVIKFDVVFFCRFVSLHVTLPIRLFSHFL